MPKAKLRDCGLEQVRIRSPRPERPVMVSSARAAGETKAHQFGEAAGDEGGRADAPSLLPAAMPAAMASTFFTAPPISTPRTSVL